MAKADSPTFTDAYAPTLVPKGAGADGPPSQELVGTKLGDYVVMERLGIGGMGVVYAGLQPQIGKPVAIKVLRPEIARDPAQTERLFAEARALAKVQHRGIVDIFTIGQLPDGRHYLVMELLEGKALHDHLAKRGALPPREALTIADDLLSALGAAHEAGLVHRDLKPSNVFLQTESDGGTCVKVLDFGLAKQSATPESITPQTRTDVLVGTPEYIAPEQARGASVGPTTDLYAVGVVLFEMLTGRLPFSARTPIDLIVHHLQTPAPLPSAFAPGVPPALDELVRRLLEKEPALRPRTAAEARAEVARIQSLLTAHADLDAVARAAHAPSPHAYVLRLGTRFELGLSWITPSLRTLEERRPERTIHLHFGDSPDLIRELRDAQLDCAVTSARLKGEWIRRADLHEETYVFVAPKAVHRPGLLDSAADAESLCLLDIHADLPLFRYFSDAEPRASGWRFRRTELLGTIAAIRQRLLDGVGVAVLPAYFIGPDLRAGAVVPLFPELPLQKDRFRLVWREGHPRDAEIAQLAEDLRQLPLR